MALSSPPRPLDARASDESGVWALDSERPNPQAERAPELDDAWFGDAPDFVGADLRGVDLSGRDLRGVDFTGADLRDAQLVDADLRGAILHGANLTGAEMARADLRRAVLDHAECSQVGLGEATLVGASCFEACFEHASFVGADLRGVDLRQSRCAHARLRRARLEHADFSGADLSHADLVETEVDGACFKGVDFRRARMRHLGGFERAVFIEADIRDVDFSHAYLLRRFIMDQNYLAELRSRSRYHAVVYWLWWATSDCGRSLSRLGVWIAAVTFAFGFAYTFCSIHYGDPETWLSPYYFSLVTLTTLGYGDVLPASAGAQALVMMEVVVGYMMLGGMISIFANKMARRAE